MKNLKPLFFTLSILTGACSQQNAFAMHQESKEMSEQEQLQFLGSLLHRTFLNVVKRGACQATRALVSREKTLQQALRIPELGLLAEIMDQGQYAIAHMLVEEFGADIAALSQEHQELYTAYLFEATNQEEEVERVAHITPHPPFAAAMPPALNLNSHVVILDGGQEVHASAPRAGNEKKSIACTIS